MDFRVLGPLEVVEGDAPLPIGGPRPRALLAVLLLRANEVVPTEQLIDELWSGNAPASAANNVQVYVSRLRKVLGARRLTREPSGYVLHVEPGELDRARFEELLERARACEPAAALELLDEALALWRGAPLADVAYEEFAQNEIRRLEELRALALEQRVDARLAQGQDAALVPELEALVEQFPLRERLCEQLMLALYRAGRQAEALAAYQRARQGLVDELGIEPSRALQELQRAILRQDDALSPAPVSAPPSPEEERLKVVTCVFCDASTSPFLLKSLDPEALRALLARFIQRMEEIAHRHGGAVSTFMGDAVLAVFGLPAVHEDDALRAARTAAEMRDALPDLGLDGRIAVTTGEVVAGGDWPVTGEAVRAAARLAQSADLGGILIADATLQLVRDSVVVDLGRARTWRLVSVSEDDATRGHDSPFVGRTDELAMLQHELDSAVDARTCRLCTILGPPGIGKSRLAREFVTQSPAGARVVVGRCRSYGVGITYSPLAEIVEEVTDLDSVLADAPDGSLIARRVAGVLGATDAAGPVEETFWAFRRLFETLAGTHPLIVVVEDVHWAEPTLLDLLEYVAGFSTAAPILLLCLARPDLLDARPSWTAPRPNTAVLPLEPLPVPDAAHLVRELAARYGLPDHDWPRVAAAAEGNPLFLEQLVAAHADDPARTVPPTIQALLAERIERLPREERALVERGAVEGRTFHRGAVAELLPSASRSAIAASLVALVRKGLIVPGASKFAGDDAFRFGHGLIAEAAYNAVPKRLRVDLHERLADWLESRAADDEIAGHHLEQSYRYRVELATLDEHAEAVAARAAAHLASAGEHAYSRDDMPTAASLLQRALALPGDPGRIELRLRYASALLDLGRTDEAEAAADAAAAAAAGIGDHAGELRAELFKGQITIWTAPDYETLLPLAERALRAFGAAGDDRGSMEAWRVIALTALDRERHADAADAFSRVLDHARRLGSRVDEREILGWLEYSLSHGPMPVTEILRWTEEHSLPLEELEPAVTTSRAVLLAMDGRLAEARDLCTRAETRLREFGMSLWMAAHSEFAWHVEMLAGDHSAAEGQARRGYALYEEMESSTGLGLCAGMLAQSLFMQGREEEAAQWSDVSERNMGEAGIGVDSGGRRWRQVRAKLLARRGELEQADRLANDAVEWAEQTDSLRGQADALLDLAFVLGLAGKDEDASAAAGRAVDLYRRKGVRVMVERRTRLAVVT